MCEVMPELKRIEESEKANCNATTDFHLQMFYGQATLEARRMQKVHRDRCEQWMQEILRRPRPSTLKGGA